MSLTCKVRIVLDDMPRKRALAVQRALAPDNVDFPENLTMRMENTDNKLVLYFEATDSMKSLISTIDEVLEHVQVSVTVTK